MKITQVADDLTGRVLGTDAKPVTVKITIDGKDHELDLTEQSASAIKALGTEDAPKLFAAIFSSASSSTAPKPASKPRKRTTPKPGEKSRAVNIREWCAAQGIEVNDKGRIPNDIQEKYDAAQK